MYQKLPPNPYTLSTTLCFEFGSPSTNVALLVETNGFVGLVLSSASLLRDKSLTLSPPSLKDGGASLARDICLLSWRESNEGSPVESKDKGCQPLLLFSRKGFELDFLMMLPTINKTTDLASCGDEADLRKGCPRKDLMGRKDGAFNENIVDLAYKNFIFFSEHMGLPVEGFEKEVGSLLSKLEACKGCRVVGSSFKRRSSSPSWFERELQKLEYFVNYNLLSGKGRRSKKSGLDLVFKCQG